MFLTRMISGFICAKNSNSKTVNNQQQQSQQQQQQQQNGHYHHHPHHQTKSPKPSKKTDIKCKRSLDPKRSMTDLLRTSYKDAQPLSTTSTSTPPTPVQNTCPSQGGQPHVQGQYKDATKTHKPPTKVKSGSWKRSEKQISTYNALAGKKTKTLRKRSPTWLKFSNSPMKIAEKTNVNEVTSVCRPGTLYSDVLFGAGSSCLVKIKTLTPRRAAANSAQKKLTKALLKCSSGFEDPVSGSETETDRELFPSLSEFNKSGSTSPSPTVVDSSSTAASPSGGTTSNTNESSLIDPNATGTKTIDEENADVVILSVSDTENSIAHNGYNADVSYGSYLEQHFQSSQAKPSELRKQPFIDIPQWNFVDVSADTYPKFLCQFEDEHYLNTEQMALLGLKLALGNNSQQPKFKF